MTNEELIQSIQDHIDSGVGEYEGYGLTLDECRQVIKALESQLSEDCISREGVINAIKSEDELSFMGAFCSHDRAMGFIETIKALPSVTPSRPKGKWIEVEVHNCHATLKCSVCDRVIEPTFTFGEYSYEDIKRFYPFCHCGADMRESEGEE